MRVADLVGRYVELAITNWRLLLFLLPVAWLAFTVFGVLQEEVLGWSPADFATLFDLDLIPVAFVTAATAQAVLWGPSTGGVRQLIAVAGRAFPTMLAVTVLVRLAVVVGFLFLVLPAIAAAILFGLAAVIMMAERPAILASLRQSFDMVLSAAVKVAASYVGYILSLVAIVFAMIIVAAAVAAMVPQPISGHVTDGALAAALSISHTVFAAGIYQVLTEARQAQPSPSIN
ncbi:MAG: YciC family protein [Pseudomonadota bacterium]